MQLKSRRPPNKSEGDTPSHYLKEDKPRSIAIVGALFIQQGVRSFDAVEDNHRPGEYIEMEDVRVVLLAPLDKLMFWMVFGNDSQVTPDRVCRGARR